MDNNNDNDLISIFLISFSLQTRVFLSSYFFPQAWSITYHSWLTFILLLWACVLWMFPNQRRAMLVSSPGLVIYAEILLFIQYIYSLSLTDDELPQNVDGVNLAEIGLVKPSGDELPFHPILVKVCNMKIMKY